MTLVISVEDTKQGSIGCSFEEGIGLYELFEYDTPAGRQFVVKHIINEDSTKQPAFSNLISLFSSNPYNFKYIFQ